MDARIPFPMGPPDLTRLSFAIQSINLAQSCGNYLADKKDADSAVVRSLGVWLPVIDRLGPCRLADRPRRLPRQSCLFGLLGVLVHPVQAVISVDAGDERHLRATGLVGGRGQPRPAS